MVNPKSAIRVTFPDGTVFQDRNATTTLLMAVEKIGLLQVASVGLSVDKSDFVSKTPTTQSTHADWHQVGDWYVNTHSSTSSKVTQLTKISKALSLDLKIEIVSK